MQKLTNKGSITRLKAYHSIIIFAVLTLSAIFSSVSNYRKAQYAIVKDMDHALALTIQERQDQWITPDTIQSYRSHLSHQLLRQTSILCYAEEKRNGQLTSRLKPIVEGNSNLVIESERGRAYRLVEKE